MTASAALAVLLAVVHAVVETAHTPSRDLRAEAAGKPHAEHRPASAMRLQIDPVPSVATTRQRPLAGHDRTVVTRPLGYAGPQVELKPAVGVERSSASLIDEPPDEADLPALPGGPDADWTLVVAQIANLDNRIEQYSQVNSQEHAEILQRTEEIVERLDSIGGDHNPFLPIEPRSANLEPAPLPDDPPGPVLDETPPVRLAVEDKKPPVRAIISEADPHRYSIELHDADVAEALKTLAQLEGINIVVGKEIAGTISANLHDVTVTQAIDAVLKSQGYSAKQRDGVLYVAAEPAERADPAPERKTVTRQYRPQYVDVDRLLPLVDPLLTDQVGTCSVVNDTPQASGRVNAGRFAQHAAAHGILRVTDYEDVVAQIDAVIATIDVPPRHVVLDTLIVHVTLNPGMPSSMSSTLFDRIHKQMLVESAQADADTTLSLSAARGYAPGSTTMIAGEGGLRHGILLGDLRTFLEALRTIGHIRRVASPQLQFIDGRSAELSLGDEFRLNRPGSSSEPPFAHTASRPLTAQLTIRPSVHTSGAIHLDVEPHSEGSPVSGMSPQDDRGPAAAGATALLRDGKTLVIGGLYRERVLETLPRGGILSRLSWLQGGSHKPRRRVVREELVVLLTPRLEGESPVAKSLSGLAN